MMAQTLKEIAPEAEVYALGTYTPDNILPWGIWSSFLSVSSMSAVTGGFVAILKSINDTLTPAQYKEILVGTSHPAEYENDRAEHVADIGKAVQFLIDNYGKQRTKQ